VAKLRITGNGPLKGSVTISGAKNAALPCMAASLLSAEPVNLENLPMVADIHTMGQLLDCLGAEVELADGRARIRTTDLKSHVAPYELVKTMRASVLALGPLLARMGRAQVSLPGGCAIGARPVNLHLQALTELGAQIDLSHGYIEARATKLRGGDIYFETPTVTGTENLMMAATLAEGTTILRNAAREPEIIDLADLLRKMGASIQGDGSDRIVIEGRSSLGSASHRVIPDRIETGTYICAAAITGGEVRIRNCSPDHCLHFLGDLDRMGVGLKSGADWIEVAPAGDLRPCDIQTQPYPGFPTDMQAQFMALLTQASGRSLIIETIFENRFMHAYELGRLGANIRIDGHTAVVDGITKLSGAEVRATDLRASASLVIAALVADGDTLIHDIHHLERGYDRIAQKLNALGAAVKRV